MKNLEIEVKNYILARNTHASSKYFMLSKNC